MSNPEDYAIKTIRDKDKHIEELEYQLEGYQSNYNDTGILVNGLRKRIAELEMAIRNACDRITKSNDMPEWDDVYQILIPVLYQPEGGADE